MSSFKEVEAYFEKISIESDKDQLVCIIFGRFSDSAYICRFVLNVETLIVKLYGNAWRVSPDRIAIMEKCVAIVSHNTDY